MRVSDASVWRQIERDGARHGVIAVRQDGLTFAGEAVPALLPLTHELSVIVRVDIPICRLNQHSSTMRDLLARRKRKAERSTAERREAAKAEQKAAAAARKADLFGQLEEDWKSLGRLHFAQRG